MINAEIDSNRELVIKSSSTSSKEDLDFLAGNWTIGNKRLKKRLNNSTEWLEYKSTSENL